MLLPGLLKTPAIVLARSDFSNTSRIFTFLTPDQGLLSALLKGARRSKGRPGLGGGLDLLSENEILAYQRRSGLAILAEWSEVTSSYCLGQNAVRFSAAGACAELVRECSLEKHGEPTLYKLLSQALELLKDAVRVVPVTLRVVLGALTIAGFKPEVEFCTSCRCSAEEGKETSHWILSGQVGGILCGQCRGEAEPRAVSVCGEVLALLRALMQRDLVSAGRLRPSRKAERELLKALEHYSSWKLEKRIKSLASMEEVLVGLEAVGCR